MSPPDVSHRSSRDAPRRRSEIPLELPAVDERLVMPGTPFEIIEGRVVYVPPANEPHGTCQVRLAALLQAHAAKSYLVATEMLTRTSATSDMAPDASVYPAARDKTTGGRRLEELAFEIVSTQRISRAAKKARALTGRGVRRVFAIDVKRERVLVWSPSADDWEPVSLDSSIQDKALAVPLPVRPLLEAALADDVIAAALIARKNPVIEGALREGKAKGLLAGKIESLLTVLSKRGIEVPRKAEKRIRAARDERQADTWLDRAIGASNIDDVLRK